MVSVWGWSYMVGEHNMRLGLSMLHQISQVIRDLVSHLDVASRGLVQPICKVVDNISYHRGELCIAQLDASVDIECAGASPLALFS